MDIVLLLVACASRDPTATETDDPTQPGTPPASESDTDTDTDSDTDTDTDADTDTDTDTDTHTPPKFSCSDPLPPFPYKSRNLDGTITSEDIDIDPNGYVIGSDRENIYRTDESGYQEMLAPNINNAQMIVALPTGDIVLFEEVPYRLIRIAADGEITTLADVEYYVGFGDANASGLIYATAVDRLLRIDPFAETIEVIYDWWNDHGPWGIAFDEDYTALYVSVAYGDGKGGGTRIDIYRVELDAKGDVTGDPELFASVPRHDVGEGLAVDECGNVYLSMTSAIFRISKDGKTIDEIWTSDKPRAGRAIAGLSFGRAGKGGTDPMKLYASNPYGKDAVEIDVGVPGRVAW